MFTMCDHCYRAYESCPLGHATQKATPTGPPEVVTKQSQAYTGYGYSDRDSCQPQARSRPQPQRRFVPKPYTTFYQARPAKKD